MKSVFGLNILHIKHPYNRFPNFTTSTKFSYVFLGNTSINLRLYCSPLLLLQKRNITLSCYLARLHGSLSSLDSRESSPKIQAHFKTSLQVSNDQEGFLKKQLNEAIHKINELTIQDWQRIKSSVLEKPGGINKENADAIILSKCCELKCLALGKSYFNFLKTEGSTFNRAIYGNYMRLFYVCGDDCNEKDSLEIKNIYHEMLERFPILDPNTAEKAVIALSTTEHWREYKKLFEKIEMVYPPSAQSYSAVIKAAFRNQEFSIGWDLFEEAHLRRINISDEAITFWLLSVSDKFVNKNDRLSKVFNMLEKFHIIPSLTIVQSIHQVFEESGLNRKGTFTQMLRRGQCKVCQTFLQPAEVSQEDYQLLRKAFLNPVLIGKDIFLKTQPDEFNRFLQFLEKESPFDVVLDGLNIAFKAAKEKKSNASFAFQLKSVVKYFVERDRKVLVLGRKHVQKWPPMHMNYIYQNSSVFLAEDISQDDPFLLYATLYSGLGTQFVSQDLMRGHKFLLADPNLQNIFQRWQAQHQYFIAFIADNGDVCLKKPIEFMQSTQKNLHGDWHIPYTVKELISNKKQVDNFHEKWLCLVNDVRRISSHRSTQTTRNVKSNNFKSKISINFGNLKK